MRNHYIQGRNKVQKIGGANPPKKSFKNSYFPLLYGPSKKIWGAIAPPVPPVVTALYLIPREALIIGEGGLFVSN